MAWQPEVPGCEIGDVIGRGGFSTVYRARQPDLNRVVAVKIIESSAQADADAQRRFQRECQAIGSLTGHHAVVTVHAMGATPDGHSYIVMEHLDGGSLQEWVSTSGPLAWPEVAAMGIQVAEALDAAHELGILHRDVKPANVMIDRFGRAKLGDFGIAALAASGHTTAGTSPATVAYAAPEVLLGQRASVASDLYGLGATLYALLAGVPAYAQSTDESVVPMVMRITGAPVPSVADQVAPAPLRQLILELMGKDPELRPADAREVARRLRAIEAANLNGETVVRTTPTPPPPSAARARATVTSDPAPITPSVERSGPTTDETVRRVPQPASTPEPEPELVTTARVQPRAADDQPPTSDGPLLVAPLRRRLAAVAVDLAIMMVLLGGIAYYADLSNQVATTSSITIREDGVEVSPATIRSFDRATTLLVTNDTDRAIRVALRPLNRRLFIPAGGAGIAAGETREFGVPMLEHESYDLVTLDSNGGLDLRFRAVDGTLPFVDAGMASAPSTADVYLIAGAILAVAILLFGWAGAIQVALLLAWWQGWWTAPVLAVALYLALSIGMRLWRAATPGEMALGLAVRSQDGQDATLRSILIRWATRPLSGIALLAGYLAPLVSEDRRPWHDRIAKTVVTRPSQRSD